MEIAYAVALRKPIFAFSADDEDYSRKTLFQAIAGTPEELIRFLEKTTAGQAEIA
jgi:hypothetical protein